MQTEKNMAERDGRDSEETRKGNGTWKYCRPHKAERNGKNFGRTQEETRLHQVN